MSLACVISTITVNSISFVSLRESNLCVQIPWWLGGKESTCQCRRCGFDCWVGKIPWRRKWLPTPVFLPAKSHGQRSLAGYSPWGCKILGHDWACAHSITIGRCINKAEINIWIVEKGTCLFVQIYEIKMWANYNDKLSPFGFLNSSEFFTTSRPESSS